VTRAIFRTGDFFCRSAKLAAFSRSVGLLEPRPGIEKICHSDRDGTTGANEDSQFTQRLKSVWVWVVTIHRVLPSDLSNACARYLSQKSNLENRKPLLTVKEDTAIAPNQVPRLRALTDNYHRAKSLI
jgi:hypothetical protein